MIDLQKFRKHLPKDSFTPEQMRFVIAALNEAASSVKSREQLAESQEALRRSQLKLDHPVLKGYWERRDAPPPKKWSWEPDDPWERFVYQRRERWKNFKMVAIPIAILIAVYVIGITGLVLATRHSIHNLDKQRQALYEKDHPLK